MQDNIKATDTPTTGPAVRHLQWQTWCFTPDVARLARFIHFVVIRGLLADQKNASVMLGNVTGIDPVTQHVIVDADDKKGIQVAYDYLVLVTGATHSYFGHDEFARFCSGTEKPRGC